MPVVCDVSISIETDNLLRRADVGHASRNRELLRAMLSELQSDIEKRGLLRPCFVYKVYAVKELESKKVLIDGGVSISGSSIAALSHKLKALAVVICTIGDGLENRARDLSGEGRHLEAFLLDGAGSAYVDALAAEACHLIEIDVSKKGLEAGSPLSPGMPGMPITEQETLFSLAPADEIGVTLSGKTMMKPLKSLSMVVPIGEKMPTWSKIEMCNRCNLSRSCRYRFHVAS